MHLDIKYEALSEKALAYLITRADAWGVTPKVAAARILDETAANANRVEKKRRQRASKMSA